MTEESAARSLAKLGNTPFEATDVSVELDAGLMLPASSLNALRRAAAEALRTAKQDELSKSVGTVERRPYVAKTPQKGIREGELRTARFAHPSQITRAAKDYFDLIYLPLSIYDGSVAGVVMPPVIFDSEREEVARQLKRAVELGARHLLLGNLGHLPLARESGLTLHGDFRFNVTNGETAALLQELGLEDVLLSPELTLPQVRDLSGSDLFAGTITYGRIPLMLLEKCVIREIASCDACHRGEALLTDRKGAKFPVLREGAHRNVVYNSVPTYMADREGELKQFGIRHRHFLFSVERAQTVDRVLRAHREGQQPAEVFGADAVRRIK